MQPNVLKWPKPPPILPPSANADRIRALWGAAIDQIQADRSRWVLWIPVIIAVGVAGYFSLPVEPPLTVSLVLGSLIVGAGLAMPGQSGRLALIVSLALLAGFLAAQIRTQMVSAPRLSYETGVRTISGQIDWIEPLQSGRWRLVLSNLTIERIDAPDTPKKVRLTVSMKDQDPARYTIGTSVRLKARLSPPGGPLVPGGYDFARSAYFQQIGANALVAFALEPIETAKPPWAAAVWAKARRAIAERIEAALPSRLAGLAKALIIGARGEIDDGDLHALRDAGLAHILAISGLHIGLVAGFVFFLTRGLLVLVEPIALRWPVKKIAAGFALVGAGMYLGLSGASISTQRAFIMLSVALIAILLDRPALTLRSVALAATLILLWRPESLLSPGFQMSFGAVIALVAAYEWAMSRKRDETAGARGTLHRIGIYLFGVAMTTLIAETATTPISAYHFNHAVTYGILGNEIAMPILALAVMPCAVISVLAMPFGLEALPLAAMGFFMDKLLSAAHFVSSLPSAVVYVQSWGLASLLLAACGGLWLCLWTQPIRWLGVLPVLIGVGLTQFHGGPDLLIGPEPHQLAARIEVGGQERVLLLGTRLSGFRGEVWTRKMGHGPKTVVSGNAHIDCDRWGCVFFTVDGGRIMLVKDGRALLEDCRFGGVLISTVDVLVPCNGPDFIVEPSSFRGRNIIALRSTPPGTWTRSKVGGDMRPWSSP